MSLIIIQHADKERGPGDPGLTPLGRAQAIATAERLTADTRPVALYASPLRRAIETAEPR